MTTNSVDNKLEIPLAQAAHLAWLQQAADRGNGRVSMEHIKVGQGGDEAVAVDGFRLHAIRIAEQTTRDSVLYQFAGRLVRFGKRLLRKQKQSVEYSLADGSFKFPSLKDSETARLLNQKPLAVFSLDPKFMRQALQDATEPVVCKVYANGTNCHLIEFFAEEDGVQRYALVMGCTVSPHLIDRLSWRPEELNP